MLEPNLPNLLSAVRLPLAVMFPMVEGLAGRVAILLAAASTDWLDGRVARARAQETPGGALLDPVADKFFVAIVLATLVVEDRLPLWAVGLILLRDLGVALGAGVLVLVGRRFTVRSRRAGKAVTWLQFAGLGVLLAWPGSVPWVAAPIAALGVLALVDYARSIRRV